MPVRIDGALPEAEQVQHLDRPVPRQRLERLERRAFGIDMLVHAGSVAGAGAGSKGGACVRPRGPPRPRLG